MANAIMVIFPYRYQQTWVFDDETVGLVKEPFVSGIPKMLDVLVILGLLKLSGKYLRKNSLAALNRYFTSTAFY